MKSVYFDKNKTKEPVSTIQTTLKNARNPIRDSFCLVTKTKGQVILEILGSSRFKMD